MTNIENAFITLIDNWYTERERTLKGSHNLGFRKEVAKMKCTISLGELERDFPEGKDFGK